MSQERGALEPGAKVNCEVRLEAGLRLEAKVRLEVEARLKAGGARTGVRALELIKSRSIMEPSTSS